MACHKENYPTLFINQISDDCVGNEIFSFIYGLFGYNQMTYIHRINTKQPSFVLRECLHIKSFLLSLKMLVPCSRGLCLMLSMTSTTFLDYLPSQSHMCKDHLEHLHMIFIHYQHYTIHLNPHKCIFCVEAGNCLRFVASKHGIHVDPLKVESIINLPPPRTIIQLQSL